MNEKPLVSICITCYNQVNTIRGAIESALFQTYSPVEIVICDDASIDGTDKVIISVIDDYRKKGGKHRIIYKRNEENLNVVKNYEQCFLLSHGELLITGSGDDVSMPYRAERLVAAWIDAGRKPTIIHHAWYIIDSKGRCIGHGGPRDSYYPLGACSAYRRDVFTRFPLVVESGAYEDMVFCSRAGMIGDSLCINDKLVCYRYGGTTTSFLNHFDMVHRGTIRELKSQYQMALDVAYAKEHFNNECIADVEGGNLRRRADAIRRMEFFDAKGMCARWHIGRKNGLITFGPRSFFQWCVYCFPKPLADVLSNTFFVAQHIVFLLAYSLLKQPKEYREVKKYCVH